MKRHILTLAALALTAVTADAGPIRDRLAARFARPCQSAQCQPQPQYQPGPVQQVAANVIQATGQVVQSVGQAVYQMPTFRPSNCPTCVGGVCR
jgi:hypothetical protein